MSEKTRAAHLARARRLGFSGLQAEQVAVRLAAWDARIAYMMSSRTCTILCSQSTSKRQQTSFEFGPRSAWPRKG